MLVYDKGCVISFVHVNKIGLQSQPCLRLHRTGILCPCLRLHRTGILCPCLRLHRTGILCHEYNLFFGKLSLSFK